MGQITDRIREHVGEGELKAAIEIAVTFLKTKGGELYNQALHLKGKYREYERDKNMLVADRQDVKSQISLSVLALADQIDEHGLESTPTTKSTNPTPEFQPPLHSGKGNVSQIPPPSPKYVAQLIFNTDAMQYYITSEGQIMALNPLSGQTFPVGIRYPSQDLNFAWLAYFTITNIYYPVDHNGIIWGQNFGMPVQVGQVRYFR